MKLSKNTGAKKKVECPLICVENNEDGKFVLVDGEVYDKLLHDNVCLRDSNIRLTKEKEALTKKIEDYKDVLKSFQKYIDNQNKGINQDFAYDCFQLMKNNQGISVKTIYEILKDKFGFTYESTRLYCKAINEKRIFPKVDNNEIVMVGRLI